MSEALLTPNEKRYRYLQYQLKLRQITLAQIAQDLDVSISHVQRTLQGHRQSPRIRAKLIDLLGCDVLAPDFDDYPKDLPAVDSTSPAENHPCTHDTP